MCIRDRTDAGSPVALGYVVPRADGSAVALALQAKPPTMTDLVTGDVRTFAESDFPQAISRYGGKFGGNNAVHREWSFSPDGALHGWQGGRVVTIPPSGAPHTTTFVGENAIYGQNGTRALGMNPEGRLFQTIDRGMSWLEVAPPPSHPTGPGAKRALGSMQCGALGCILGPWLRIGFREEPPRAPVRRIEVPPPSEAIAFAKPRIVDCTTTGPSRGTLLPAGDREFGFGATFLPTGVDAMHYPRTSIHPVSGSEGGDGDEQAKRAMSQSVANLSLIHISEPTRPY